VTVPDVVGMTVADGTQMAYECGLALAQPDPDGPPLRALTWPGVWLITEQHPAPGTRLRRWDSVIVRFRSGDGAGPANVRAPLQPPPHPGPLAAEARPSPSARVELADVDVHQGQYSRPSPSASAESACQRPNPLSRPGAAAQHVAF
jgi:hypothetical protein